MEAVAKYDFTATAHDELSFTKGTILKVLDENSDPNWFRAEHNGKKGLVPANFIEVKPHKWFRENITRASAEDHLNKLSDGEYLVRESESSEGDFSLSVKFPTGVQHFKILQDGGGRYFLWIQKFLSINQLLEFHKSNSVSRKECICLRDSPGEQMSSKNGTVQSTPQRFAQAMYSYTTDDPEEMSFNRGDTMLLLDTSDEGWWKAENVNTRKSGLIPATYVKLCS